MKWGRLIHIDLHVQFQVIASGIDDCKWDDLYELLALPDSKFKKGLVVSKGVARDGTNSLRFSNPNQRYLGIPFQGVSMNMRW